MKIIDLIRAQCRVQGVPEVHAEKIEKITGITEEKDGNIIAAVKNFKENILPDLKEDEGTVEEAVKKAIADYTEQLKKEGKLIEEPKQDPKVEEPNKEIAELKEMIQGLLKQQKQTSTLESVRLKLKGKMDDSFIDRYASRVNLEAENIDEEINAIVKVYQDDQQAFLNHAVASGGYQPVNGGNSSATNKDLEEYFNAKEKGADEGPFAAIKY